MNKNNEFYCRLENLCHNNISDNGTIELPMNDYIRGENVYVEYFTNISLLKERILNLTEIWQRKMTDNKNMINVYPGLYIVNQKNNDKAIGFCFGQWYLSSSLFFNFVHNYIIKNFEEEYSRIMYKLESKKGFSIVSTWDLSGCELDLLTEEIFDLELRYFLDGDPIAEEIKHDLFYSEMVNRGYIDLFNKQ